MAGENEDLPSVGAELCRADARGEFFASPADDFFPIECIPDGERILCHARVSDEQPLPIRTINNRADLLREAFPRSQGSARLGVPNLDRSQPRPRHDMLSVRTESRTDCSRVGLISENMKFGSRNGIPEPHPGVPWTEPLDFPRRRKCE